MNLGRDLSLLSIVNPQNLSTVWSVDKWKKRNYGRNYVRNYE